jgi:hypothetical protein
MFDPESKFYNIPQGFPINTLNPTIEDKASFFEKMGAKVLTMIPSIRPHNISNTIPNAKDACLTQGKEALAIFLNPNFLMLFHKLVAETHPEVLVRAYQIALDTFLNKRVFSERDLCNVFENKFSIQELHKRPAKAYIPVFILPIKEPFQLYPQLHHIFKTKRIREAISKSIQN